MYQSILKRELEIRSKRNSKYSLRSFAKFLDIDAAILSKVMSGKLDLSGKSAKEICARLKLSENESQQFLKSVIEEVRQKGHARLEKDVQGILPRPITYVDNDLFKSIGTWYDYAILELTQTANFQPNQNYIAEALGITLAQSKAAVARLKKLGLLADDANGSLVKAHRNITSSRKDLTSQALKQRHSDILKKSIEKMHNIPVEKRNHTAMTVAISLEKLPEAKARIQNFMMELCEFLSTGKQEKVYELVVNLFPLQQDSSSPTPPHSESKVNLHAS